MNEQAQQGVTESERYLHRLAKRSFLSLWSYPNVFRKPGKELCDLLVVFQNHILLFSDKHCGFCNRVSLPIAWCRWFRDTVWESTNQVFGAERHLRQWPERLFLDRICTKPFPIELPDLANAKVHRIVVARGASRDCRDLLGGSGSMTLVPRVQGGAHYRDPKTVEPFVIGQVVRRQLLLPVSDN